MAAAADLTLKNNAGTNVTFNVFAVRQDDVEWTESGSTSIMGTVRAYLSRVLPASMANGLIRVKGALVYPVVNGTTGLLDGTITGKFEYIRPANLTVAQADEAHARFKELVAQAIVKTAVESGAIPT